MFLNARGQRICCVYEDGEIFVGNDGNGDFNLVFSGTSFATPQVAGAVALLAQAFPNLIMLALQAKRLSRYSSIARAMQAKRGRIANLVAGYPRYRCSLCTCW